MPERKQVMISSTARDLPEHRNEVMDACLRQGFFPVMMEHLPASDDDAIRASLRMVDESEIYLGVLAHRYGYVPKHHLISITEMEYKRATERGIPRLIFVMHKDHPIHIEDVEMGDGAEKLKVFKQRLETEKVVRFFKSVDGLRADVIDSLSRLREPNPTAFHHVSDIPAPPETYIAHPYTLLQTGRLIGRQPELNALTEWITMSDVPVFNVVAIGGMGKSALTWHWFHKIAPLEMKSLAGGLWWSFYESDATFENFVIRALSYVTKRPREEVQKVSPPEREEQLLGILDREPFLLVLDGLERILIAYARMDAARLSDDEVGRQIDNLRRKTADPRTGAFLRKLSARRAGRVLISTRLYPADLQDRLTGDPLPGSLKQEIVGMSDDDALDLWRAFGVGGTREALLPVFRSFGKHPLLIQALAGEIKRDRRAAGDFEHWQRDHPGFDPLNLPGVTQAGAHVLEFALQGLDEPEGTALRTVAAFRMPVGYDTLVAVLTKDKKLFDGEPALDRALTNLEDRGLLGWDRNANRYDLHPIVRGVVWSRLNQDARQDVFASLHLYFEPLPAIAWLNVNKVEDLTAAIELYNTLIGLGRYDDAVVVFAHRLADATLYRLSANRLRVELLEALFPDGVDQPPRLTSQDLQAWTLMSLALSHNFGGRPGHALPLYSRITSLNETIGDRRNVAVGLRNLADTLRTIGKLRESEGASKRAISITRGLSDSFDDAIGLQYLGLLSATRGSSRDARRALDRALLIRRRERDQQGQGFAYAYLAQLSFWLGDYATSHSFADHAWELAGFQRLERDFIRAARLQGAAAAALDNLSLADDRLHHALTRARAVNLTDEELPALVALAELRLRHSDPKSARALLEDVWEPAERGPYPPSHTDALNVLAQIERDAGNTSAAIEAATQAYRLAWCDGPPFAYHWGLEKARAHLTALGAPEPPLPPFDESKFEPMPEIEINPPDTDTPTPEP